MTDRQYTTTLTILTLLAGLYWYLNSKNSSQVVLSGNASPSPSAMTPADAIYSNNPQAFTPQALGAQTINIQNQGLSYLSNKYTPLFGFVGMAQGSTYLQ